MKKIQLSLLLLAFLFNIQIADAVISVKKSDSPASAASEMNSNVPNSAVDAATYENMTKKEKRQLKKDLRKKLKSAIKDAKNEEASGNSSVILAVILAILLPPLGVAVWEGGITNHFWIALLLTILFYLPGLIYALIIILG